MIVGKKVRLRRPEGPDHQTLADWRNDPQVKKFFFEEEPITLESHLTWYSQIESNPCERFYVIDALVDSSGFEISPFLIGRIGLSNISWRNRSAEGPARFFIKNEYQSYGYGFESLYLLLDYAFNHLNLHKIWAEVISGNRTPTKLYTEMGFKEEGILRGQIFKDGHYIDVVRFGLIGDDFHYLQPELREKVRL